MLNYKVEETTLRIGDKKGEKRFQAKRIAQGRVTLAMVEEQIVQKTALSKGDVRSAIASLAEIVNQSLLAGNLVELGDLGSFSIQVNGKMVKTEKEANARSIKTPQIRYNPKQVMRQYAQRVTIKVTARDGSEDSNTAGTTPSPSAPASGTPTTGHSI